MFEAISETVGAGAVMVRARWNGAPISVREALALCRSDEGFRAGLIRALAASSFAAFFWETPPLTTATLAAPFEFVLTEARALANAPAEPNAFAEHFARDDGDGVVAFENLGGDAVLVVPCPRAPASAYAHLASFLRHAPAPQAHALVRRVAEEVLSRVSDRPLWLSTAGMGVYWLHVRLDSRPKYYRHAPYKAAPRSG
jgi:hypothetical protein